MELKHRKNLIKYYIRMKVKTGADIAPYLEKLTKDRFIHWNFDRIEEEIYKYLIDLKANREDITNTLNELKNDI